MRTSLILACALLLGVLNSHANLAEPDKTILTHDWHIESGGEWYGLTESWLSTNAPNKCISL
ncbi:MAG: hypothetical protein RLY20_290, partial [Verrucomicrobiota bacterium]